MAPSHREIRRRYINTTNLAEILIFDDRSARVIAGFGHGRVYRTTTRAGVAQMLRAGRRMGHKIRRLR